jgi:Cu-processing system permease protein
MNPGRLWTIVTLELMQRVRSVAWYVLLGVFAAILLGVTALSFLAFSWMATAGGDGAGGAIYSVIVYVVLLLVVLVSPTVAGNAVNGDRDQATLAPVQVTLATTGEIVFGKLIAAWMSGLAFVAVAVPFLGVATIAGGVSPAALVVSLIVLIVEIAVFAAIGVGLSALIARPLFSIAATYLVVAAFVIGTLIVFGLGGAAVRTEVTSHSRYLNYEGPGGEDRCTEWMSTTQETPRFDRVWWLLAANPFVIIADATPTVYDENGYPTDLFGQIASGVRLAQIAPEAEVWNDGCQNMPQPYPTTREQTAGLLPSWFVGLAVQFVVAGLLLWGGWGRTRTPARSLPPGTRVA